MNNDNHLPTPSPAAVAAMTRERMAEIGKIRNCVPFIEPTAGVDETQAAFDELLSHITALQAEADRLKRGDFTSEEIHNVCHNLHGKVDAKAFAAGCAAEQRKLYGCAPDADEVDRLKARLGEGERLIESMLPPIDSDDEIVIGCHCTHSGDFPVICCWCEARNFLAAAKSAQEEKK